jgi:hypothetical protein
MRAFVAATTSATSTKQQQNPLGMYTTAEARENTQQPQPSTSIRGDDTTIETEIEYTTTMSDGPKVYGQTSLPTEENYFFFRSDIAPNNKHRRCAPQQEWKMIRRDEFRTRSTTTALSLGHVTPSILYDYSDAISVTPMPLLQRIKVGLDFWITPTVGMMVDIAFKNCTSPLFNRYDTNFKIRIN